MTEAKAGGTFTPSTVAFSRGQSARRWATDRALDALNIVSGVNRRLDRLAAAIPVRDILCLGVYEEGSCAPAAFAELKRTRHRVRFAYGSRDPGPHPSLERETIDLAMPGMLFDNLNRLLSLTERWPRPRWTIVSGSDVLFPRRWLDRFIAVCEAFDFALAGPAITRHSFPSYELNRRSLRWVVRETQFVEIGPVFAIRDDAAKILLPFPSDIGQGWGLDLHWAHLAAEHDWRLGVVDATPVRHEEGATGRSYSQEREASRGEGFLAANPHRPPEEAIRVINRYRSIPMHGSGETAVEAPEQAAR